MSNPVFSRQGGGFPTSQAGQSGYATWNVPGAGYGQEPGTYQPGAPGGVGQPYAPTKYMTMDDVVIRTALTIGVVVATALVSWFALPQDQLLALALPAALVGFVLAMVNSFKRKPSAALVLLYAACEGVFLGAISGFMETQYPGIVIQAVVGTAFVFFGMLIVYRTGAIRVTPKFQRWLMGALIGVVGLMLVNLLAVLIGGGDGLGLRSGGALAIIFSLVCIGLAAFVFLADFDMVDQAIRRGAPQNFAWYAAFGLTVTLVWLYLEILRLLSYFRD